MVADVGPAVARSFAPPPEAARRRLSLLGDRRVGHAPPRFSLIISRTSSSRRWLRSSGAATRHRGYY
jgi:hypothetical protein